VEWPSGEATACKAVHTGSIPVSTSKKDPRAISSAGERFPDTEEVTGSIPVSRTSITAGKNVFPYHCSKSQDDSKTMTCRRRVHAPLAVTSSGCFGMLGVDLVDSGEHRRCVNAESPLALPMLTE
jgi:hypothetical protein